MAKRVSSRLVLIMREKERGEKKENRSIVVHKKEVEKERVVRRRKQRNK